MVSTAQEFDPNAKTTGKGTSERIRKACSMTQSVFVVGAAVFLAGVVTPTLLHGMARNGHGASSASLHAFHSAGVTFFYTLENLGFAFLGGLFGAIVAWAIEYPEIVGKMRLLRFVSRCRGLATSWAFRGH